MIRIWSGYDQDTITIRSEYDQDKNRIDQDRIKI